MKVSDSDNLKELPARFLKASKYPPWLVEPADARHLTLSHY